MHVNSAPTSLYNIKYYLCCFFILGFFIVYSSAIYSVDLQPTVIEADRATINEKEGLSHYSGHVVVKQGNLMVSANEVQVKTNNGSINTLEAFGNPVKFSRTGVTPDRNISGECKHLVYSNDNGLVVLNDTAKLVQGGHTFSGNRIVYDIEDDVISAAKSDSGDQRVKITIQPKSDPDDQ